MKSNDLLMILGAGPLQVPAIKRAKEDGLAVLACDKDPNAVGFNYADYHEIVSTIDLDNLKEIALKYQPKYIMTSTSDAPVRSVAYLREIFNMPLDITYNDSLCATNKAFMRERLKEHNLPIPKFYVVKSESEYLEAIKNFSELFIVKPADSSASRGVCLGNVNSNDVLSFYKYSYSSSLSGVVVVEEYIEGPEVSVEGFTFNGETQIITITDKITTGAPHFVELGHSEPSSLPNEIQNKIIDITKKTVKAIGVINGPSHTEIKITKDGPKIVEMAARLGGDYITSKLVPLTTGFDMIDASFNLLIGKYKNIWKRKNKAAAILFIPSSSGEISDIRGIDEAKKMNIEFELYHKVGDVVGDIKSSSDRIGHVLAESYSPSNALKIANDAMKMITVKYKNHE